MSGIMMIQPDDALNGVDLVEGVYFTEVPSIYEFEKAVMRIENVEHYNLQTSHTEAEKQSSIYKCIVRINFDVVRVYFLVPYTLKGIKSFVIVKKPIDSWGDDFDVRMTQDLNSQCEENFSNKPFGALKGITISISRR
jgi:hypothetical protein